MQIEQNRRSFFKYAGLGALLAGLSWRAHAHGGRAGRGGFDPARLEEHLERALKHLYVEIDATEEQKRRIEPIVKQAARDLAPLRERAREARRRGLEALAAPSVDRGAIEQLRVDQLQAADAASRRFTQALADFAEVLRPEQRATLVKRLRRHGGGWHRGGWHGG